MQVENPIGREFLGANLGAGAALMLAQKNTQNRKPLPQVVAFYFEQLMLENINQDGKILNHLHIENNLENSLIF